MSSSSFNMKNHFYFICGNKKYNINLLYVVKIHILYFKDILLAITSYKVYLSMQINLKKIFFLFSHSQKSPKNNKIYKSVLVILFTKKNRLKIYTQDSQV